MKKVLMVLAILMVLTMTGCNKDNVIQEDNLQENQNNYQEEVVEKNDKFYSNEELIEMIKKYRVEVGAYITEFVEITDESDDIVTVHLYDIVEDHVATSDWYYINRYTGKGTNFLNKEIDLNYYWFATDSYHCDTPGGFGGGMPDMYYFSDDNTYLWIISDYIRNERVIAKKGTWKIENDKLILHEQEETYLDGGKFIEIKDDPMLGDDTILVDYVVNNKAVDNIIEKSIEYIGILEYPEDSGNILYEYKLDGEIMYSNIAKSLDRSVEDWLELSNDFQERRK